MKRRPRKIPAAWKKTTLDHLVVGIRNGANLTQYSEKVGLPVTRIETISSGRIDLRRVKYTKEDNETLRTKCGLAHGDILFSHINSDQHLGKTAIFQSEIECLIHGINLLRIRPSPLISANFLNHQLHLLRLEGVFVRVAQRAVNQSSINQRQLRACECVLPPVSEQRRIVAKVEELFAALDRGVESLKQARKQLIVYRQAVLKHAFEGKLTAQWREENKDQLESADELLTRIQQERESHHERQLEEWTAAVTAWEKEGKPGRRPAKPEPPRRAATASSGGEKDHGWALVPLCNLAAETSLGKMLDREKNTGVPRPYLGNINVRWGRFDLEHVKTMPIEDRELARYALQQGDLVVCEGGEPGRCAVWVSDDREMLIQKALHRVRFTSGYIPDFARYFLEYVARSGELSKSFTGSTFKHLTREALSRVRFPLCAVSEQRLLVRILDSTSALCDEFDRQVELESARSELLRQAVLKRAFSGRLVPQDPNDEPASELLERIKSEKAASVHDDTPA